MLQRTAAYIREQRMLRTGERIVLGLSGGVDSVCLFYVLKDLGYALEAVHVHHGIRGREADRDAAFVRELCAREGVSFHEYYFDVPKIGREQHLSVEEAGRMVRRQALTEVMEKTGAEKIALAHHANDRAETFLFHLSRGTGIRGLGTMKAVQGAVVRPFLWAERREIEQYARENGYAYVEDTTNACVKYTRNKVRHELLPVFEELNPRSVAHICSAAEKLSAAADYLDREAQKLCARSAVYSQEEVFLKGKAFLKADPVVQVPALQKCVEYLTGSLENMTEEHWKQLLELFARQTGRELSLPGKLGAVRSYEGIRIYLKKDETVPQRQRLADEGVYEYGGNTFVVSVEAWDKMERFPIKTYTKYFDYDKIKDNLCLRTRESGDFLEINREHAKKSLQDYLINEKVPKNTRDQLILLADGHHILWVIGKRISEYYKVTEETKRVLKVQVCGGTIHE